MFLWRIERLKDQLQAGPLGQGASFAYVMATVLLYTASTAVPGLWNAEPEPATLVDWLTYGLTVFLVGGGTYMAYRANGGQAGSDFASRYFALGWVLLIRLMVLMLVPAFILVFGVGAGLGFIFTESERSDTFFSWTGAAIGIAFEAVFYWRLVHHLEQVATVGVARTNGGLAL